jgi:hypothetical protein
MCAGTAPKRPSSCRGFRSVIDQAYGHRERDVGLHPNPRRLEEPCWPVDDCSDTQGTGHPSERATPHGVAHVCAGPLACAARLRCLHKRGGDPPRIDHPLHGIAHRACRRGVGPCSASSAPGQRLCVSGHASVDEQIHGVLRSPSLTRARRSTWRVGVKRLLKPAAVGAARQPAARRAATATQAGSCSRCRRRA